MPTFMCKAQLNKNTSSNTGADWITATRCLLHVANDHLEAADIAVAFADIKRSTLRIVPSAFFIPGCILSIETTKGVQHHFGLRYSAFWKAELPFPVQRQKVAVPGVWLRRLTVLAALVALAWHLVKGML